MLTTSGKKKVFVQVLGITADLPADAMLRNAHGHMGTYACAFCDIEGYSVPSGDGHCMAFSPQQNEVVSPRTHQSVLTCAQAAEEQETAVSIITSRHIEPG